MKKIYLLFVFIGLICLSLSSGIQAQTSATENQTKVNTENPQGIRIFPIPAKGDILHITSKKNLTKVVSMFSVLGKRVKHEVLFDDKLDISNLNSGVYILKVKEGENEFKQKLIVSK